MPETLGFIGLGNMGRSIAQRLLAAGHHLQVYNRTRSRAEELAEAGATVLDLPTDLTSPAGGMVVFTMLADDAAVEAVCLGDRGFAGRLPPGSVHVSCSTISPALSRRLAHTHAAADQGYVAAPVLGRPEAAAAGKLFILAAGEPAALARCRPLLDVIGQRTFALGDDAAIANTAKLVCNFLIAAIIESLAEGLALAEKSGLPRQACLEVLTETIFTAPVFKTYGKIIVEDRFEPAGFKLPLGLKDIRLALSAAEEVLVAMPVASLVRDHMVTALAMGQQDLDWSSLARVVAKSAGL